MNSNKFSIPAEIQVFVTSQATTGGTITYVLMIWYADSLPGNPLLTVSWSTQFLYFSQCYLFWAETKTQNLIELENVFILIQLKPALFFWESRLLTLARRQDIDLVSLNDNQESAAIDPDQLGHQ